MPADQSASKLALAALEAEAQAADLLTGGVPVRPAFGVLYAYAGNPDAVMPADLAAALAADPRFRADLTRLLDKFGALRMPRLAAASSDVVTVRESASATLTLTPSKSRPEQHFVAIALKGAEGSAARRLLAIGGDHGVQSHPLSPFTDGRTQSIIETDGALHAALRDPETEIYLT